MKRAAAVGILVILCLPPSSCGPIKGTEKPSTKAPSPAPQLVGRIASLPADGRFVLIQSYGKWQVPPDSILTTRGPEGRTANLKATGEALGQFAAADIRSGDLGVGDAVYLPPIAKPQPEPSASPPPATTPEAGPPPAETPPAPMAPSSTTPNASPGIN